jgi:molybdate transport system substrate-binding protein
VFIAASLTYAVQNMTEGFEQANNCKLLVSSASSGALYTQITEGSPCDVFMSADNKWTNQLNSAGLLDQNSPKELTSNSLEVILAPGNPAGITSLADLTKPGVKLVIAAPSVPAGNYANRTIWKIDSTWGNSSSPNYVTSGAYVNYNASLYSNVKSYETNVENVVGAVALSSQTGLYDAGIVYSSDGVYGDLTGQQTEFLPIPADVNQKAIYGIAVIGSTNHSELAQKFMDYWLTDDGQALLAYYGFGV